MPTGKANTYRLSRNIYLLSTSFSPLPSSATKKGKDISGASQDPALEANSTASALVAAIRQKD